MTPDLTLMLTVLATRFGTEHAEFPSVEITLLLQFMLINIQRFCIPWIQYCNSVVLFFYIPVIT